MIFDFQSFEKARASFFQEMDALFFFYKKNYEAIKNKSICIAVSGGSDSLSLLILLNIWAKDFDWKLYCITVDHKLRKESRSEALYVQEICNGLNIEHSILDWNHADIHDEGKLENLAREARYNLISIFCSEKNIPFVATGHNWNDQLETYELRKSSGSYEYGLAGMSKIRSISSELKLIRPLLHFSKKYLQDFLRSRNIEWKNDSMNFQDIFKRVAIRNKTNAYSREKINQISELIYFYGKKRYETEKFAVEFIKSCVDISNFGFCSINSEKFFEQDAEVQMEILKRLIWNVGMKKYPPVIDEKILDQIINRKINTLGRCFIKIKKRLIFVFRENRNIPRVFKSSTSPIIWDNRFSIKIKLENDQYLDSSSEEYINEISRDVLPGFPCLYENHQVKYSFEEWIKFVNFIEKPDLFDIYCGVCCEQKS